MALAEQNELDGRGRVALLATSVLVIFLLAMTITIANVSLSQIQGSLSVTRDQVAWVVTAYLVANAVGLPATGWLRVRSDSPAFWQLEAAMPGIQQTGPLVREIGRQAQMIGYLNAFRFFALTAVVALPLILAVRPPRPQ
ncbi:MAG: hypothetical protein VCE75_22225 [Alphaproteobacteria bacterium]